LGRCFNCGPRGFRQGGNRREFRLRLCKGRILSQKYILEGKSIWFHCGRWLWYGWGRRFNCGLRGFLRDRWPLYCRCGHFGCRLRGFRYDRWLWYGWRGRFGYGLWGFHCDCGSLCRRCGRFRCRLRGFHCD
jgi:hypothetical protein